MSDPRYKKGRYIGHPTGRKYEFQRLRDKLICQALKLTPVSCGWSVAKYNLTLRTVVYSLTVGNQTAWLARTQENENGPGWLVQTTRSDRTWHFAAEIPLEDITEDVRLMLKGEAAA